MLQRATGFQIRPVAGLVRRGACFCWDAVTLLRPGQHALPYSMLYHITSSTRRLAGRTTLLAASAGCTTLWLAASQCPAHLRPTSAAEAA